jgi:hypothetical protein
MLVAACHCGRATIRLRRAPDYVSQCNCSLCAKTGFRGIYYASDEVEIAGSFDEYVRQDIGEPFLKTLRCRTLRHCHALGAAHAAPARADGHQQPPARSGPA